MPTQITDNFDARQYYQQVNQVQITIVLSAIIFMRVDGCLIQIQYWQNMYSFGLLVEVTQERISKKNFLCIMQTYIKNTNVILTCIKLPDFAPVVLCKTLNCRFHERYPIKKREIESEYRFSDNSEKFFYPSSDFPTYTKILIYLSSDNLL